MDTANPYNAPEADLKQGQDELYTPRILSFNGRIGRLRYLAYGIGANFLLMLVMVPLVGASALMGGTPEGMSAVGMAALAVFYVATIVISVMFAKRRLNDLNRSGWWILLLLVPLVNFILAIYLLFFPGTEGANNFGPAPAPNTAGVKIIFWLLIALFVLGIGSAVLLPVMLAGTP